MKIDQLASPHLAFHHPHHRQTKTGTKTKTITGEKKSTKTNTRTNTDSVISRTSSILYTYFFPSKAPKSTLNDE